MWKKSYGSVEKIKDLCVETSMMCGKNPGCVETIRDVWKQSMMRKNNQGCVEKIIWICGKNQGSVCGNINDVWKKSRMRGNNQARVETFQYERLGNRLMRQRVLLKQKKNCKRENNWKQDRRGKKKQLEQKIV